MDKQVIEIVVPQGTYSTDRPKGRLGSLFDLFGGKAKQAPPPVSGPDSPQSNMGMAGAVFGGDGLLSKNWFLKYAQYMETSADRIKMYNIYEEISRVPEIGSVLDGYAEDATQFNQDKQRTVWAESEEKKVVTAIHQLFDTINVEEWIEGLAHDVAQNGDDFMRNHYDPNSADGILNIQWLDPRMVERVEDERGNLYGFALLDNLAATTVDEEDLWMAWDIIHFRIYSRKTKKWKYNDPGLDPYIYGTSLLYNVERTGKQVRLLEELMMIYRLTKSVDRFIYYVDVGPTSSPAQVTETLRTWRLAMKKREFKNPLTGEFDVLYNPMSFDDDIFYPVRGDRQNSRVDVLPAAGSVTDAVDYDNFINKLFAGLRAPKAYFGYEGDVDAANTLSSQDVRFARGVKKIQRAIITGLTTLCEIHLLLRDIVPSIKEQYGIGDELWEKILRGHLDAVPEEVLYESNGKEVRVDTESIFMQIAEKASQIVGSFKLRMVEPSQIELLQRLEAMETKLDVAQRMLEMGDQFGLDPVTWRIYILTNVVGLSADELKRFGKEMEQSIETGEEGEETQIDKQALREALSKAIRELVAEVKGDGEGGERPRPRRNQTPGRVNMKHLREYVDPEEEDAEGDEDL